MIINPNNIIPFILYFSLFYIPINLINIYQIIKYNNIGPSRLEFAHRMIFITIGIIPLLSLISRPIKQLLIFK